MYTFGVVLWRILFVAVGGILFPKTTYTTGYLTRISVEKSRIRTHGHRSSMKAHKEFHYKDKLRVAQDSITSALLDV